jgi:hypothetical protein
LTHRTYYSVTWYRYIGCGGIFVTAVFVPPMGYERFLQGQNFECGERAGGFTSSSQSPNWNSNVFDDRHAVAAVRCCVIVGVL